MVCCFIILIRDECIGGLGKMENQNNRKLQQFIAHFLIRLFMSTWVKYVELQNLFKNKITEIVITYRVCYCVMANNRLNCLVERCN